MAQQPESHHAKTKAAAIAVAGILGAFLSRWHGGGFISGSPKLLKAFLWSLPFALATGAAYQVDGHSWTVTAIVSVLVLAGCMVFKNTGHGGGMDLAHNNKEPGAGREPEKLEYLILWLHGRMPQYWYDFTLLTIIGTASTLLPAVAIGIINPLAGMIVLAGGTLGKPCGYAIGWLIYPKGSGKGIEDLDHATAIGEALTGLFAYTALAGATIMVIF